MAFPSSFCYPNRNKCPHFQEWDDMEECDLDFCLTCEHFVRDNEYDEGSRRTGYLVAFICEKDCMNPEIYYTEPEPNMPWE